MANQSFMDRQMYNAWRIIPGLGYVVSNYPPFLSHERPIWKGNNPILRGQQLTMVIIHLPAGMILQVELTAKRP